MRSLKCFDSAGSSGEVGRGQSRKRWRNEDQECFLLGVIRGFGGESFSIRKTAAVDYIEPSSSSGEVVSWSAACGRPPKRQRSTVLITRRGRAQVLPSRFFDSSAIKTWRREIPRHGDFDSDLEEESNVSEVKSKKSSKILKTEVYHESRKRALVPCSLFFHESSMGAEETTHSALGNVDDLVTFPTETVCTLNNTLAPKLEQRENFHSIELLLGDVVWAKPGNRCPAWPAVIIKPMQRVLETIQNSCSNGAVCVMFFGYFGGIGQRRKYALVNQGMIFPFVDYLDRFQGQTDLNNNKPSELRLAIEDAFLAEQGFMGMEVDRMAISRLHKCCYDPFCGEFQEATSSNHDQECLQMTVVTEGDAVVDVTSVWGMRELDAGCGGRRTSKRSNDEAFDRQEWRTRQELLKRTERCSIESRHRCWSGDDGVLMESRRRRIWVESGRRCKFWNRQLRETRNVSLKSGLTLSFFTVDVRGSGLHFENCAVNLPFKKLKKVKGDVEGSVGHNCMQETLPEGYVGVPSTNAETLRLPEGSEKPAPETGPPSYPGGNRSRSSVLPWMYTPIDVPEGEGDLQRKDALDALLGGESFSEKSDDSSRRRWP
ncbi:Histone-lysine N-methyltransferase ATX4 [Platanthera guangdongensis]|uniref:Histone-lysine N-methyltransferase ATX4 n=1 Tax=Platanthera guangdongensis TaxID=2320717 RepID=A0ABR2LLT0_9ASPA